MYFNNSVSYVYLIYFNKCGWCLLFRQLYDPFSVANCIFFNKSTMNNFFWFCTWPNFHSLGYNQDIMWLTPWWSRGKHSHITGRSWIQVHVEFHVLPACLWVSSLYSVSDPIMICPATLASLCALSNEAQWSGSNDILLGSAIHGPTLGRCYWRWNQNIISMWFHIFGAYQINRNIRVVFKYCSVMKFNAWLVLPLCDVFQDNIVEHNQNKVCLLEMTIFMKAVKALGNNTVNILHFFVMVHLSPDSFQNPENPVSELFDSHLQKLAKHWQTTGCFWPWFPSFSSMK